ncbi:hypothetical protein HYDPIDRAFT_42974 [Hydnomerulius pinastri MD-312]|uniref:U3 small nucleolar RNA-associated protein 10 n=1 Tax=Hydnomerulius pinastri MD-312 TaxID=994086 RepID=A0A0C9VSM0_9AGAM|nr:hypothetical protein HYDPIDRAFT_42974 [Hydnomerulius pinastri MD-312]
MPSALAAQLAASASLNASFLQDRSKKRQTESYLFTGRDAEVHDLDSIHALATGAFAQLCALSPALSSRNVKAGHDGTPLAVDFEQSLFSDAAKSMDRTLQTRDVNANLDRTINAFLGLLGPWLLEVPTSKVLEWLVRRFRINEFNVDAVLSLFLPYHEAPHFVKMLSILHVQPNSPFAFLLAFKSAAKPLARSTLVKAMVSNTEVARFAAELLPTAVKCSQSHRTLLAFNAATMHDYISSAPTLDDGMLAFILPALLGPLQAGQKDTNVTLGSYVLLCTLSHKVNLTPPALSAIIGTMATQVRGGQNNSGKGVISTTYFVKAAVAICSVQDQVQEFSTSTGQSCSKMTGFAEEINKTMGIADSEKFLLPLLRSLRNHIHDARASSLFSTVINSTNTPSTIIKEVSSILVRLSMSAHVESGEGAKETTEKTANAAHSLLSLVHQRHPELLRDVADKVLTEATASSEESSDDRKERRKRGNELLASFSLSHPLAESSDINEVVVASASTGKDARVDAVERLYLILRGAQDTDQLTPADMASIQSALLGRVYDTNPSVLQALYSSPDLFLSTVIPTTSPQKLLDIITSQLQSTPPARAVLHAHVGFLAGSFIESHPECSATVQQVSLFPFLLASKAKLKTARGVWEAIKEHGGFQTGWLRGCVDVWDRASLLECDRSGNAGDDGEESIDKICEANLGVAGKIADNILASNETIQETNVMLSKLHDPLPHARALAYLVCRALLIRTSGDQQILMARQILQAMRLSSLEGEIDLQGDSSLQEVLNEQQVGVKATIKPGGRGTTYALQVSILVLIPALSAPRKFSAPWISVLPLDPKTGQGSNDISEQYVSLMQDLYILASSSAAAAPAQLSTALLQALFLNIRDSSLAFLLGILLSTSSSVDRVRTHALLHLLAFLRGHTETSAVDFQTALPSLIAILLDVRTDKRDRALIFESIALLGNTAEKKHVYGLDTIYGPASSDLQYVDTKDLSTYITAILESRDQLVQDANYIKVFNQRHFEGSNVKYKRRVLCFLLSHIITHPFPLARIALLRSIEDVADFSKSHMLLPVVKELTQDFATISQMFGASSDEYTSLVIAGFLATTSSDLGSSDDSEAWPMFVGSLRAYFQSNSSTSARMLFANALEQRLFSGLDLDKRSEICVVLLQAGAEGGDVYLASKTLLGNLLRDVPLIIHLLAQFQPSHVETDAPVSKRAKLDKTPHTLETDKLQPLTLLAEVLGTTELPGSLDLVSHLLEALSKVIRSELWGPSDSSYVCQMLMAAIENSATRVMEPPARPIRLDVLVELIRVSDNPQTFNEALLLMANLARLTPDSVLHNIMPIFTFMGSNVFHRDDSYSFKVVQNTIDSIVPVMASSLMAKHSSGLELYIGSRDFLRIFADASNHIPRHRRQNFFVHLTEVLGPQKFLAPVCMLLVDKVTNRASRQAAEEAQNSLTLPTSLLRHFARSTQIMVLTEVLRECLRLTSCLTSPNDARAAFLNYTRDEEHSASASSTLKRRIQALIVFSSTSLTPSDSDKEPQSSGDGSTTDLITHLVDLATLPNGQASEGELATIVPAAQSAIGRIMSVISAGEFLTGALVMLKSEEPRIKSGALKVISERIPVITEKVRQEQLATVNNIIHLIRDIITRQSAGTLVESALSALKAIGSTSCAGEEPAILATLPHIIKVVRSRTSAAAAVAVLPCYISALGPRIIPYFKDIAQECAAILRECLKGKSQLATVGETALMTLESLLSSLPAFYGATELTEIAKLYVEYNATSSAQHNPLTGFTKAIAKKTSAGVLLPVLYDLWPSVGKAQTKEDVNGMVGYFTLFKRALQAAPRPEVLESLRQIFKVFMEAFEVKMTFGSKEGEPLVISAFIELVVKLNENVFRPLFRRLHDWAFAEENADNARKTTFCHVYTALLDYFKGLMNPYMSTLLRPLTDVLQSFSSAPASASYTLSDTTLWSGTVLTITKSLEVDEGVFWREDKLSSILPHLLSQLPTVIRLPSPSSIAIATSVTATKTPKELLTDALLSLTSLLPSTSSDLLKRFNLDLLMHTRSEDARIRIMALECAGEMWKAEGGKLIGFVAETATFVAECAEDENDSVVREAHKLKNAVESVAGSISGL